MFVYLISQLSAVKSALCVDLKRIIESAKCRSLDAHAHVVQNFCKAMTRVTAVFVYIKSFC
jgi:hypothetical protein